jgi:hypothetical protein
METGAIRKRTRRLRAANPRGGAGCQARPRGGGPRQAGASRLPAGRSAILRKHAEPSPRASYQR